MGGGGGDRSLDIATLTGKWGHNLDITCVCGGGGGGVEDPFQRNQGRIITRLNTSEQRRFTCSPLICSWIVPQILINIYVWYHSVIIPFFNYSLG